MPERILWIDVIRGISILAMITFHFAFDLMYFGFAKSDLIYQPDWRLFERMIAFSFLFIAGLSLFITHGSSINWKSFIRRYGVTALCAALISTVTYILFNVDMIRFGMPNLIISTLNKIYVTVDIKAAQRAVTPYLLINDFQLIDDPCVIKRLRPAMNKKLKAIMRSKSRQSG